MPNVAAANRRDAGASLGEIEELEMAPTRKVDLPPIGNSQSQA